MQLFNHILIVFISVYTIDYYLQEGTGRSFFSSSSYCLRPTSHSDRHSTTLAVSTVQFARPLDRSPPSTAAIISLNVVNWDDWQGDKQLKNCCDRARRSVCKSFTFVSFDCHTDHCPLGNTGCEGDAIDLCRGADFARSQINSSPFHKNIFCMCIGICE